MCGIFGIFAAGNVAAADLGYIALYALQHRGQESAGMSVSDGEVLRVHKGMGLVSEVFSEEVLERLPGPMAVGHVRYATTGEAHVANAQPLVGMTRFGQIALAHNGNLTNTVALRQQLLGDGALVQSATDSELILHLIARSQAPTLEDALVEAAGKLVGAFSLAVLQRDRLVGLRDPLGIRPLVLGRWDRGWILASESAAITAAGAEPVRDVAPGEMVIIDASGLRTRSLWEVRRRAFCVFEFIYFSRPDSDAEARSVHRVRKEIGRMLAQEHPLGVDLVLPTPDSSLAAAQGYAEAARVPYDVGLVRNAYVGRTFIQSTQALRSAGVRVKLHPIRRVMAGKRVALVDDSIVRGTTTGHVVRLLREAGAREVHVLVASPPFLHPCYYGIDVPSASELIAAGRTVDEVARLIGADSLHYLSLEGLCRAVGMPAEALCHACFTGEYPTDVT